MTQPASQSSFFRYVLLGLLVWGLFIGLGAFLGPQFWSEKTSEPVTPGAAAPATSTQPDSALNRSFDYRKPVIVVVSVGLFVGIWGALLYSRQQRLARASKATSPAPLAPFGERGRG